MRKYTFLLIALCASLTLFAQKETNNWLLGRNAGITWNSTRSYPATGLFGTPDAVLEGIPTEIVGSPMSTAEGCYSLSDSQGNLLFYSDGRTIYTRKMKEMENGTGMFGDASSAQSGVILPYPDNKTKFISLSLDATGVGSQNVLAYSIVDMDKNTNGGFEDGAVMDKNIIFTGHPAGTLTNESMTAIKHANGRDYWIIAPSKSIPATYLNAWQATPTSINHTTPVTTLVTNTTNNNWSSATGYIKFTADGKRFVWGTWGDNRVFFGDFDASNGQFSNIRNINVKSAYGLDFSPSGKYMYVTEADGGNSAIRVYDYEALLAASNPSTVPYKRHGNIWAHGAVQLGPDQRIYIARYNNYTQDRSIYIVENPDDYDNLKFYLLDNFITGDYDYQGTIFPGYGGITMGLPSFSASWFDIGLEGNTYFCNRTLQKFTILVDEYLSDATHLVWDWGDGNRSPFEPVSTGPQSFSNSHAFDEGKYTITVEAYKSEWTPPFRYYMLDVEVYNCGILINPHIPSKAIQ